MILTGMALFSWLMLKSYVHLPDAYHRDYDRDPPRYAEPVDYKKRVFVELPTGSVLGGAHLQLRFDGEDRTLGSGGSAVRFRVLWTY